MNELAARILKYNQDRNEKLVSFKYEGMAENMFRFFRGTNHLFVEDLFKENKLPQSPLAWISGDLHIENFGSFKSDNRLVYFDLNDFDESILAPLAIDLARMVVSIFVAFASLEIEEKKARHMGRLFLSCYANTLKNGRADYIEPKTAKGLICEFLSAVSKRKQKDILHKKTQLHKNKLEILLDDPKHIKLKKSRKKELMAHISDWLKNDSYSPYNYKVIDAVFRLAGTASVGLDRYAVLLKSSNDTGEKYLLLDIKEAIPSSLRPFISTGQPEWENEAERILSIQQLMQNRSPALLSTTVFNNKPFVIQEIQPTKDKINFKLIKKQYRSIYQVIADMASLTAYAHLRSAGRERSAGADELIGFGKNEGWQELVFDYAMKYDSVLQEYYRKYMSAFNTGVFTTQSKMILIP